MEDRLLVSLREEQKENKDLRLVDLVSPHLAITILLSSFYLFSHFVMFANNRQSIFIK